MKQVFFFDQTHCNSQNSIELWRFYKVEDYFVITCKTSSEKWVIVSLVIMIWYWELTGSPLKVSLLMYVRIVTLITLALLMNWARMFFAPTYKIKQELYLEFIENMQKIIFIFLTSLFSIYGSFMIWKHGSQTLAHTLS